MLFSRYRLVHLMLASILFVLVANVEQADAGLTSYLPSMRVFNPFYWYGSAKSNASQIVEDDISRRSDKCTDQNLCPLTGNFSFGSLAKNKNSSTNSTESLVLTKVSTNNGTSTVQVSTTRAPVASTTTVPNSTTTMTSTITTSRPTLASGDFPRGALKDLFTTKKPNILIDKPTQWPKKFKIMKNGKVYDMPGLMSNIDHNVSLLNSDNSSNKNSTNYQYIVVAHDSGDDKKDNHHV